MVKTCRRCGVEKSVEEFYRNNRNKELYRGQCKKCMDEYANEYKIKNLKKLQEKNKEYYRKNKDLNRIKCREYREKNKERLRLNYRKWRKDNKDKINEYNRKPINKVKNSLRARINGIMNKKYKNPRTLELVGCDYAFLMEYIENKFTDGMTWENYGYHGWHIDHITPLCTAKTEEELIKLFHYTNLQPLWAEDNFRKAKKTNYLTLFS